MPMKICRFLFILIFVLGRLCVGGADLNYLSKLSISEGLPHNGVTAILQDAKGYMWIATYDGLCRYDGYECKVFKNTVEEKIFPTNRIRSLWDSSDGNLWIGTDEGVTVYEDGKFKNIYSNSFVRDDVNGPIVRKIIGSKDSDYIVCATEDDGVFVFKKDYSLFKHYKQAPKTTNSPVQFLDGIQLDHANYLFATSSGLLNLNLETGDFTTVLGDAITNCKSIQKIDSRTLLVTQSFGVAVIEYEKLDQHVLLKMRFSELHSDAFVCSAVDTQGVLWLGTMANGIVRISDAESFINRKPHEISYSADKNELLRSSCICADGDYGCWFGTFNEGIYRFDTKLNPFKSYNTRMKFPLGLRTNEILHIDPSDKERVYVSANRGGMTVFNTTSQQFEPLRFNMPGGISSHGGVVFVDSRGDRWIKMAGNSRLYRQKVGEREPQEIVVANIELLKNAQINNFEEDQCGNIWLGGFQYVFKLTLNENRDVALVESLNENPIFEGVRLNNVRVIYADPLFNFVWIGTNRDGLIRIDIVEGEDLKDAKISRFNYNQADRNSIPSNFISSIIRLPNNDMWIGTEGAGICKVLNSNETPKFINYSEKQGLSNNVVKAILYDNEDNLWISTNIGLNKFYIRENRFRSFNLEDGLPFLDFVYAATKLSNGTMLFGGLDGFVYFNPAKVLDTEKLPILRFGDIQIYNQTINPGDTIHRRVLLSKKMDDLPEITLKHNENVFAIEVTSLHYSTPDNHFIKYQLSPVNDEWIKMPSGQPLIYFNDLHAGSYVLRVMASNSVGKWTQPRTLIITVTPPFWATKAAYLLYFVIFALVVYAVMYYLFRMNKLKHRLEIEEMEKNAIEEINAAKLRFFSNISHEIKTPLTILTGSIRELAKRYFGNPDLREKLELVERQTKKISQLVEQVNDFQKAEAYQLKLHYSYFCFNEFIEEVTRDFQFMAESCSKKLVVEAPESNVFVTADRDKLEKMLNNLLNNAFKYTDDNDTIIVKFRSEGRDLILSVADTGAGISNNDLPHVFERFYQSANQHGRKIGSGIGLAFTKRLVEMHYGYISVESELGKGATFIVRLPVVADEVKEIPTDEKMIDEAQKHKAKESIMAPVDLSTIKAEGNFSDANIFFVEDDADMRNFVAKALSSFFRVKTFQNGKECLTAMQDEWPDLVLSDLQMPEMDGFELCQSIKSDIKTSHIPVVLLTASTSIENQIAGIKGGADDYIHKPFDMEHLVARIEGILHIRRQLRERFQIDLTLNFDNTRNSSNDSVFLEKLYNLMSENLDNQDLDLDNFARELYLNRTNFYQKVKALTNQTPFELLKMYRLKKAAELLSSGKYSVNEVFEMTGFKSRTHFSKLFKEVYHVTPGKYASEIMAKY